MDIYEKKQHGDRLFERSTPTNKPNNNKMVKTIELKTKERKMSNPSFKNQNAFLGKQSIKLLVCFFLLMATDCFVFAQNVDTSDENLVDKYIASKNLEGAIVFDASNIKQFWIDNSVVSKNGNIVILLNKNESQQLTSVPYHLKLINVNGTQDCRVDVVSEKSDIGLSVVDSTRKVISGECEKDSFINYTITSTSFHLDESNQLSFDLVFNSKKEASLSIKKIVLSFSKNKNYLYSPGERVFSSKDFVLQNNTQIEEDNSGFSLTGRQSRIVTKYRFIPADKKVSVSVTIKNTGETKTLIYYGFMPYTSNGESLKKIFYPYKTVNKIFKVVSSKTNGDNTIVINSMPEWTKGCSLALDAKEDMSDIPNQSILGTITDVKKIDDNHAEIVFEKPIQDVANGTLVRINNPSGFNDLFLFIDYLEPGEEKTIKSTIGKDEDSLDYSVKAFCKGIYSVSLLIQSSSSDPSKMNTILVKDFSISY